MVIPRGTKIFVAQCILAVQKRKEESLVVHQDEIIKKSLTKSTFIISQCIIIF